MNFKEHSDLVGQHAFLSASKPAWVNYDVDKMDARWLSAKAATVGTLLHEFAQKAVELGIKQSTAKKTLNMYINDCIGYKMTCEQPLYYSPNAFGTADAVSFRRRKLRIHDLKTGVSPTSFRQLEIYAAYFCLEYGISPFDITIELRIYQNDEIRVLVPNPEDINYLIVRTMEADLQIELLKEKEANS